MMNNARKGIAVDLVCSINFATTVHFQPLLETGHFEWIRSAAAPPTHVY